jgi:hypothetical protein
MVVATNDPTGRYNDVVNYADQVAGVFQSTFPPAIAGSSTQARALLAGALAVQVRNIAYPIGFALNKVNGVENRLPADLFANIIGDQYGNLAYGSGITPDVVANFANEFVTFAFPACEAVFDELADVAGSPYGVPFSDPFSIWSGMQKAQMNSRYDSLERRLAGIAAYEQNMLTGPNAHRNLVWYALTAKLQAMLGAAGEALDYLDLEQVQWDDSISRINMVANLVGPEFTSYVGLYGVGHTAALEFATRFADVMLDVVEAQVDQLENERSAWATEVAQAEANAQAVADAQARELAAQQQAAAQRAVDQAAADQVAKAQAAVNEAAAALGTIFPNHLYFEKNGNNYDRFEATWDQAAGRVLIVVNVFTPDEWKWPDDQLPPGHALVAGMLWQELASKIPATTSCGTAVAVTVRKTSY